MTHNVFGADEQAGFPVALERSVGLAELVVDAEQVPGESELSIIFVEEDVMADLNQRFLGRSGSTDVLAFPLDEEIVLGGRQPDRGGRGPGSPAEPTDPPTLLGDVVVCPAVADRQARGAGTDLADEISLLVVHGVLHLLNYDHADPDEAEAMKRRERELLEQFRARERQSDQAGT